MRHLIARLARRSQAMWGGIVSAARISLLRTGGVALGPGCHVGPNCEIAFAPVRARMGRITAGPAAEISRGVIIRAYGGEVTLGANVYLGPYCVLSGHGGVEIGDDTLLSMHCTVLSSNHTVPAPGVLIRSQPDILLPTKIGRDVWLGAGVSVLGGVTIGNGCIVGAGAVATHDLPPESISVGVPARVVGHRSPQ
jgi:acetyltransferase-like isoleucine patch superfamily enzyme